MPRCSIIIPVYNKASLTRQCLNVLLSHPRENVDHEIIVVDDASTDTTPELLAGYGKRIRVVTHKTNGGFAAAVNDGAAAASGEFLVFLNNDTIPQPGWLEALVRYADSHPRAAAVGSKLLFPNGTIQHAGVIVNAEREPAHIYAGFPADHPAVNKSRRFQIVTAACILIRRAPFEQVGGFDTAYRNSCEDVDLCLRLGELGHEVHYCHESVLYHLESVSPGRFTHNRANGKLYRSRWAHRVQPDDWLYYIEDELLSVNYWEMYPLAINVSPLLAVIEGDHRQADVLLKFRARQVWDLLRDNIRLSVRVQEIEQQAAGRSGDGSGMPAGPNPKPAPPEARLICEGDIRWLATGTSGRLISLVLPVHNGAAGLRELLPGLFRQRSRDRIEIIAVDFGSTDDTVDLLRQHRATVIAAGPQPVCQDLTRQLAARYARGTIWVLLDPGTRPVGDDWLANLIAPLDRYPDLAGGYFTQGEAAGAPPVAVFRVTPQLFIRWAGVNRPPVPEDPLTLPAHPERRNGTVAGVHATASHGWRS
jgi:GT2 family glycosyltransferase